MNSTAVIIGAMLISPLMGPINGIGFSLATYDFDLFKRSVKNFSFAILSSLAASTAYFLLSPISTAHSELLARTSPTIYDVLIALFGGSAGIVAINSKQKGNVIPGVAIATALMPPLCTAGYGIAIGQLNFFFGAFYLFTINTIFIAISSLWITRIIKFPIRNIIENTKRKKIKKIINAIVIIVFLPSVFFGYKLVKNEKFLQKANNYISNISNFEGNYLLKHTIDPKSNTIVLTYVGPLLNDNQKSAIIKKATDFNIQNAKIIIEQGLTLNNNDDKSIELYRLKEQIMNLNEQLNQKNHKIDSMSNQNKFGLILLNEIKTIYPQIQGCYYSESLLYHDKFLSPVNTTVIILSLKTQINNDVKNKINNWFMQRLNNNNLKIFYE